jgi:hypothetical protein
MVVRQRSGTIAMMSEARKVMQAAAFRPGARGGTAAVAGFWWWSTWWLRSGLRAATQPDNGAQAGG